MEKQQLPPRVVITTLQALTASAAILLMLNLAKCNSLASKHHQHVATQSDQDITQADLDNR